MTSYRKGLLILILGILCVVPGHAGADEGLWDKAKERASKGWEAGKEKSAEAAEWGREKAEQALAATRKGAKKAIEALQGESEKAADGRRRQPGEI